jgi:hypothetical protein
VAAARKCGEWFSMPEVNWLEVQQISLQDLRDELKEHFPEYMSAHCLCGEPIATYIAWVDHIIGLLRPKSHCPHGNGAEQPPCEICDAPQGDSDEANVRPADG